MEPVRQANPHFWLNQVFSAKAVLSGGVVRRSRKWVDAEIGFATFEQAVRARGYHLLEAGDQLVVICHSGPVFLRF